MKSEYDFSKGERGKFFREGAEFVGPVHLEPAIMNYLSARAEAQGVSLNTLVNRLLEKDIELLEAAK